MLSVSTHPLIAHDLTLLRDRQTKPDAFRRALHRISQLLATEATVHLDLKGRSVRTPLEEADGWHLEHPVILVPVLRAGLGMIDAFLDIIPEAHVGHIGLYRNEDTLQPVEYYSKYPDALAAADVFILDPMLATGGSAAAAANILKRQGARRLRLITLVAAPEGVRMMEEMHPDIVIHTASLDHGLNEKGYIVPGLGDAGDRIFGTGSAGA
ncbi:MAG: uracil phosphoribosyltransferase [Bacteroidetes bacterium]|nr:uracil phosphoribosyltransferase [Bacteroidota bacterium]